MNYLLICNMSGIVHTGVKVHRIDSEWADLWNNLSFSLYTAPSVCHVITTSDDGKKSKMEVSADWYVTVEH